MMSSTLNWRSTPSPWHTLHAPNGELNEKTRGESSGMNAPWSGQAKSSDQATVSPTLVKCDRVPSESFSSSDGASMLSIATVPPPNFSAPSTDSVRRWRRSFVHRRRSILTSISWRKFLSNSGGFSNPTSCPLTLPWRYPCSTSCRKRSACVPFRARTAGAQRMMAWPSVFHTMSSTISWTVRRATSLPQVGQCGLPIRAHNNRK